MSKRKLRRIYRRYLFSYTFEALTPRPVLVVAEPKTGRNIN